MSERKTREKKQSGGQNGTTDKRAEGEKEKERERKPAVRKRGSLCTWLLKQDHKCQEQKHTVRDLSGRRGSELC